MCGIVGILGRSDVTERVVEGLSRLEYRGYDSAGVALMDESGQIAIRRSVGKLQNLRSALEKAPLSGLVGIGHTRWATHGAATEANAHPHVAGPVAVVHNGIIENFAPLRDELRAGGAVFASDTDTEVIAQLCAQFLAHGKTPQEAVAATLARLRGAFALAFLFAGHDDVMIGARRGSPLAVGHGVGEMYLGSDALALAPMTGRITYLEEGDMAVLSRAGVTVYDAEGRLANREMRVVNVDQVRVDKGNYRHFMAKEIHEQPSVLGYALAHYQTAGAMPCRCPKARRILRKWTGW